MLSIWKRCPPNTPNKWRRKNICICAYVAHQISGICRTCFSTLIWQLWRLSRKLKKGWVKSISSMVWRQGLTPSWPTILFTKRQQTSCWASAVNNLQDGESSDGRNSSDEDMWILMKSVGWTVICGGSVCEYLTSQYPTLKSSAVNMNSDAPCSWKCCNSYLRVQKSELGRSPQIATT